MPDLRRPLVPLVMAAACTAAAAPVLAQSTRSLDTGARVRVHLATASRSVVAEVAEVRPDTLILSRPGTRIANRLPVALLDIERLDVSGGRRRLTHIGVLVGAVTGAALVGIYNGIVQSQCQPSCPDRTPAWAGALAGGATFGIGFHFLSAERWLEIALPGRPASPTR